MFYGWAGRNLEIDLTRGKIEVTEGDLRRYEKYLGGKGINARIFWERVTPDIAPFCEDLRLRFVGSKPPQMSTIPLVAPCKFNTLCENVFFLSPKTVGTRYKL